MCFTSTAKNCHTLKFQIFEKQFPQCRMQGHHDKPKSAAQINTHFHATFSAVPVYTHDTHDHAITKSKKNLQHLKFNCQRTFSQTFKVASLTKLRRIVVACQSTQQRGFFPKFVVPLHYDRQCLRYHVQHRHQTT